MDLLRVGREIVAPIEKVWDIVADFGKVDRWIPEVKCSIEGRGIGALRTILYPDGRSVCERLERFEPEKMLVAYSMVSGGVSPLQGGQAVLQLRPSDRAGVTIVDWAFTARAENHPDLPEFVASLASRTVDRIERLGQMAKQ